jgi:hypothetical protein
MNPIQIGLAALAAALVIALGWITDWGQDIGRVQLHENAATAKADGATVLPDFKLGSEASAYALIADKPLLNPTRKPAPTQPIAAVAPEPPRPQIRRGLYQLVGVSDFGGVKVAQVREVSSSRVRSVRVGDALQELTVRSVAPESITLAFAGEEELVTLPKFTQSSQIPQPRAVAQAAPIPQSVAVGAASALPPAVQGVQASPAIVPSPSAPPVPVASSQDGGSVNAANPSSTDAAARRRGRSMGEVLGIHRNRPAETPPRQNNSQ